MSVAVKTIPNRSATVAIGSWSGRVTCQNLRSPVAPSTLAASCTSVGIDASPAMKITVANGRIRQACATMIGSIASLDQHDRLRGEREDDRVPQRSAEVVVVPRLREVVEPDELAAQLAGGCIRHAQVHREHEWRADEQDDEQSCRADQRGREETAI